MTKINIISGFLGAGKTTLIKKLIAEAFKEKIVLIENEFGDISVDGGFLKEAGIEMKEMNSGCICCSLVGDFEAALKQVIADFAPGRIIIEPSGVGKLSDVKKAVAAICTSEVVMDGCITVVHAGKAKMYARNFGEFFADQVASADCLALSRTQSVPKEKLDQTIDALKDLNPAAPIVTTPWDDISGENILHALRHSELLSRPEPAPDPDHDHEHDHHHESGHEHGHDHEPEPEPHHHHHGHECTDPDCSCHHHHDHHEHHHHDHHADEVFMSWGRETADKYSARQLEQILNALADEKTYGLVLRAKGIVASSDDGGKTWLHFNYVPEEASVVPGAADYTGRISVIGSQLNISALDALFS